jgi:hypothetical protein
MRKNSWHPWICSKKDDFYAREAEKSQGKLCDLIRSLGIEKPFVSRQNG